MIFPGRIMRSAAALFRGNHPVAEQHRFDEHGVIRLANPCLPQTHIDVHPLEFDFHHLRKKRGTAYLVKKIPNEQVLPVLRISKNFTQGQNGVNKTFACR